MSCLLALWNVKIMELFDFSAKDEKEVALCIRDLNAPSFYPTVISIWVADSFERRDLERGLLSELLVNLTRSREGTFSPGQLVEG